MQLCEVKHQGNAHSMIQRAVQRERIAHAYIFHGPDGVGKELLASGFAQLMLCSQPVEKSIDEKEVDVMGIESLRVGCSECEDCRAVFAQSHPDMHLITRQLIRKHPDPIVRKRKGLDIGVDVLRHFLIEKVGHKPIRGRAKFFIVREADRMTIQAQNALLKTLEEPPGNTIIILLVSYTDRLLPTTLSRCQIVNFQSLPTKFIQSRLAQLIPDGSPDSLQWYARNCEGSLGKAIENADDGLFDLNQRLLKDLAELSSIRSHEAIENWTEASKSLGVGYRKRDPDITDTEAGRRGLQTIFRLAAGWYADVLKMSAGDRTGIVNLAWDKKLQQTAKTVSIDRAVDAVNRLARAQRQLNLNANTQLVVDALMNDLSKV